MSWLDDHLDLEERWRDDGPVTWSDAANGTRPTAVVDPFTEFVEVATGDPAWLADSLATMGFEVDEAIEPITVAELDTATPMAGLFDPVAVLPMGDGSVETLAPATVDDLTLATETPTEPEASVEAATTSAPTSPPPDPGSDPVDAPVGDLEPSPFDPVADAISAGPDDTYPDDDRESIPDTDPFDELPDGEG